MQPGDSKRPVALKPHFSKFPGFQRDRKRILARPEPMPKAAYAALTNCAENYLAALNFWRSWAL